MKIRDEKHYLFLIVSIVLLVGIIGCVKESQSDSTDDLAGEAKKAVTSNGCKGKKCDKAQQSIIIPDVETFDKVQIVTLNTETGEPSVSSYTISKYDGYIVEFKKEPIIKKKMSGEISARAVADHLNSMQLEHQNAINDISARLNKPSIASQSFKSKEFYKVFNGIALDIDDSEVELLRDLEYVKAVYPNYEVHTTLMDSVPLIGAPDLWDLGYTGEGIDIAIIDTGVDYTHNDLGGCIGGGCKVVDGYDFVNDDSDPMDDQGHGTHCAAIAAGSGVLQGVAPDANIFAYKVLNSGGSGSFASVIAGIERAVDPNQDWNFSDHVDVISMSLGGPGSPDDPVSTAVDNAVDAGVVVVVAAGNSGPSAYTIGSPGTSRKALTVGATDKNDDIAEFSSRGPVLSADGFVHKPEIVAPGVDICAAQYDDAWADRQCIDDEHVSLMGTSMATPHVAGAAALMKQMYPESEAPEIKALLVHSAVDIGEYFYIQGNGRMDLSKAVKSEGIVFNKTYLSIDVNDDEGLSEQQKIKIRNLGNTEQTVDFWLEYETPGHEITYPDQVVMQAGGEEVISIDFNILGDLEYGYHINFLNYQINGEVFRIQIIIAKNRYVTLETTPGSYFLGFLILTSEHEYVDSGVEFGDSVTVPLRPDVTNYDILALYQDVSHYPEFYYNIAGYKGNINVDEQGTVVFDPAEAVFSVERQISDEKGNPMERDEYLSCVSSFFKLIYLGMIGCIDKFSSIPAEIFDIEHISYTENLISYNDQKDKIYLHTEGIDEVNQDLLIQNGEYINHNFDVQLDPELSYVLKTLKSLYVVYPNGKIYNRYSTVGPFTNIDPGSYYYNSSLFVSGFSTGSEISPFMGPYLSLGFEFAPHHILELPAIIDQKQFLRSYYYFDPISVENDNHLFGQFIPNIWVGHFYSDYTDGIEFTDLFYEHMIIGKDQLNRVEGGITTNVKVFKDEVLICDFDNKFHGYFFTYPGSDCYLGEEFDNLEFQFEFVDFDVETGANICTSSPCETPAEMIRYRDEDEPNYPNTVNGCEDTYGMAGISSSIDSISITKQDAGLFSPLDEVTVDVEVFCGAEAGIDVMLLTFDKRNGWKRVSTENCESMSGTNQFSYTLSLIDYEGIQVIRAAVKESIILDDILCPGNDNDDVALVIGDVQFDKLPEHRATVKYRNSSSNGNPPNYLESVQIYDSGQEVFSFSPDVNEIKIKFKSTNAVPNLNKISLCDQYMENCLDYDLILRDAENQRLTYILDDFQLPSEGDVGIKLEFDDYSGSYFYYQFVYPYEAAGSCVVCTDPARLVECRTFYENGQATGEQYQQCLDIFNSYVAEHDQEEDGGCDDMHGSYCWCGDVLGVECSDPAKKDQCVLNYQNGEATLTEVLGCVQVFNS